MDIGDKVCISTLLGSEGIIKSFDGHLVEVEHTYEDGTTFINKWHKDVIKPWTEGIPILNVSNPQIMYTTGEWFEFKLPSDECTESKAD